MHTGGAPRPMDFENIIMRKTHGRPMDKGIEGNPSHYHTE